MHSERPFDYFYVVRPGDNLTGIIKETFSVTTAAGVHNKSQVILKHNPHIQNADQLRPGMFIRLGLNQQACFLQPSYANDMQELERLYAATPSEDRETVEHHSDILNWLTSIADKTIKAGEKLNETIASSLRKPLPSIAIRELTETYTHTMVKIVKEVRQETVRFSASVQVQVLERRLIKINLDYSGVRAYTKKMEQMVKVAKRLKVLGWITTAIDLGDKAVDIYKASGTPKEELTIGKMVGSTLGSSLVGGGVAYGVCNIALGIETLGTSLFWCSAIVGGPAAFLGGKVGEQLTEKAYKTERGKQTINKFVHLFTIPNAY